jgi:heat-inducible transcriptional repressor
MKDALTLRHREILDLLVSDYIASAQPVGSRTIARRYHNQLSPASIRNVMADLSEMGLLSQPHISAGRVPTAAGMRYYVNTLLKRRDLTEGEMGSIVSRYQGDGGGVDKVLHRTSKILATVSCYAGLVATPTSDRIVFKQIEFVPLSRSRLLGILVTQDGMVQNRLIEIGEELTYPELERIANYCNSCFAGLTLEDAMAKVSTQLELDHADYDKLLKKAMIFSKHVLDGASEAELVVDGQAHLLDSPEFAESNQFRMLLTALEEKRKLLHLLERCREGDGVSIFIGTDTEIEGVDAAGMVVAPYFSEGRVVGAIGVIGPIRMDYSHVVPIVDFTSKVLSDVLDV